MIYICIPTHNEQQTVGVVLWKLRQVLTDFPREYQLLVADDASTDKTADVLEPYTRVLPLTVIRSETRQGTAASLEMLLREAVRRSEYPKRDAIVTLQADFSDEPDDLVPLIKRLEAGADVAIGNKISPAKETRARRYSRMLARFFMRRQKWPEGVVTPFDGYRAYRLYSIRRAMEARKDQRLLQYDSWAGNAELLRAVLPHARRVDVVDVDDRSDRLQRPRREKPLAAAMQVRAMAGAAEPEGLAGVQELDRIAQTASRSRERAAATARSLQTSGTGPRTNGSRDRKQGQESRTDRSRGPSSGAARTTGAGEDSRRQRNRSRTQTGGRAVDLTGGDTAASEARRQPRKAQGEGRRRKPRTEQGAAPQAEAAPPLAEGAVAPEAVTKPKRKRRRRKKSGQGTTAGGEGGQQADAVSDQARVQPPVGGAASLRGPEDGSTGPDHDAADGAGHDATSGGTGPDGAGHGDEGGQPQAGEKKRRRRGGRRGGRGRRRTRAEGSGEAGEGSAGEAADTGAAEAVASARVEQAGAQSAARVEND